MKSELTKSQFAATDRLFRKCCELAGVQPSPRQASKFRGAKGKGKPRQFITQASLELEKEASNG